MKQVKFTIYRAILGIGISCFAVSAHSNPLADNAIVDKGIYGEDNRIDFYQAKSSAQKASKSVAALFKGNSLRKSGSRYKLDGYTSGRQMGWCSGEPFIDQPIASFCSGFLIAPDRVATAGHCIKPGSEQKVCSNLKVVFGYQANSSSNISKSFPERDVYQCKSVVTSVLDHARNSNKKDWAVFQLDRPVKGRAPLKIRTSNDNKLQTGTQLSVIGFPTGLPLKIAHGGEVKKNSAEYYFTTNLDTYGGNSGSPVFDTQSILRGNPVVEGILVRGAKDYVRGRCISNHRCADRFGGLACGGEDVIRAENITDYIQAAVKPQPNQDEQPSQNEKDELCTALPGLAGC